MIFESNRLYFREILPDDADAMFEMDADPDVHRFLGQHPIDTIDQAKADISFIRQQYVDYGVGRLAIIEKESDQFVGWGAFKMITENIYGHQNFHDLGYRFIKRYWGKGYATEAAKASIDYGFNVLKLPVIYAIADVEHRASRNVLEKCAFINEGTFEYDGSPHVWYTLNRPTVAL
ncbi:RimJ/RimL family protein N-acetyltransferase [Pedobacter sp. CAN_A7]|uniref:GNAT family N-acetyltransferase n=1 Tax=Pedobacter sp. CAN_A7 TaxID=2787722 RepID=UPI0018CB2840